MAKFCGNCGAKLDDNARVCGHCGTPVAGAPTNITATHAHGQVVQKEQNNIAKRVILLVIAIIVIVLVVKLVSGVAGGNSIVGQWRSETNESLVFNKDGSCDAPFTYNAAWLEAADHYTVSDDGTLSMFGSRGSFTLTFEKVETEEEALESYEDLTYYISGDTLIIAQETYTRVG